MPAEDWLRNLTEQELDALVKEVEARAEQFDSKVRVQINDELRRRKLPLIGFGKARY